MRRQIAKLTLLNESWEVVYFPEKLNPFEVYYHWYDNGEHKKKMIAYADLTSCLHYIARKVTGKDWRAI